jgi:hypothetical protein
LESVALDHSFDQVGKVGIGFSIKSGETFDENGKTIKINNTGFTVSEVLEVGGEKKYIVVVPEDNLLNGANTITILDASGEIISEEKSFNYNKEQFLFTVAQFESATNNEISFASDSKVGNENIIKFTKSGELTVDLSNDDRGVKILLNGVEIDGSSRVVYADDILKLFYGDTQSIYAKSITIKFVPAVEL